MNDRNTRWVSGQIFGEGNKYDAGFIKTRYNKSKSVDQSRHKQEIRGKFKTLVNPVNFSVICRNLNRNLNNKGLAYSIIMVGILIFALQVIELVFHVLLCWRGCGGDMWYCRWGLSRFEHGVWHFRWWWIYNRRFILPRIYTQQVHNFELFRWYAPSASRS